jgi:1,4-alpha-glucan branching enzyme/starch synthase (maltosyl-transferring)
MKKIEDVQIENVMPTVDNGNLPARKESMSPFVFSGTVFCSGHEELNAAISLKKGKENKILTIPMRQILNSDNFEAVVEGLESGSYKFRIEAWISDIKTWAKNVTKWLSAGERIDSDLKDGVRKIRKYARGIPEGDHKKVIEVLKIMEKEPLRGLSLLEPFMPYIYEKEPKKGKSFTTWFPLVIQSREPITSSWYEVFPRSCSPDINRDGTLQDTIGILDYVNSMGFNILYLTPIHPIGETYRRGKNGKIPAEEGAPGSPWAIGNKYGGHKSINPALGDINDFEKLVKEAQSRGMKIAMDLAFQCSPDHPYVKEHPEWFYHRPDGSIRYAENPPKKYYDIYPLNFYCKNRMELWDELKSIVDFWISHGITIFRVDNPHTKPLSFWSWLIAKVKGEHPDVIFLAEAFTKPDLMYRLSKIGFQLSYSYFTWKNYDWEIREYFTELNTQDKAAYFRPVLFTNTPDILPYSLQNGGRSAFIMRAILAGTLSTSWGIYSGYELCENTALPGKEEYLNSEKYEIKHRDLNSDESISEIIGRVNEIRSKIDAFSIYGNLQFLKSTNPSILCYVRKSDNMDALVIVNIDPFSTQESMVDIPDSWKCKGNVRVHDLLGGGEYEWNDSMNYVKLIPEYMPAHIFVRVA